MDYRFYIEPRSPCKPPRGPAEREADGAWSCYCSASSPHGYGCTRRPGHRGDHIAGTAGHGLIERWRRGS